MSIHTRDPESLGYEDYLLWTRDVVLPWFAEHIADPDFPSHILDDLSELTAKITDYEDKLWPYLTLIQLSRDRNKLYTTAFENIYQKLKQIKWALPTVAEDPDVLATFGLSAELPDDREVLYLTVTSALAHWDDVSGDAEFAPMVPDFDALQTLFDDFNAARLNYLSTDSDRATAQNEVLAAREAIHVIERETFTWYRSRWPNGKDEAWTDSPWTKTSGGGEAETGTKFSDKPVGVSIEYYTSPKKMLVVKVAKYVGQTGFDVRIAWGETGGAISVMPNADTMTNVPFPVQYVEEILPGKTCYAWVRARKDDEVTDWADVVSVDVPGVEPEPIVPE